ncbi:phosphatidylglycerophosphatase and protein-tyrosine phosphatase 1-like [Diaphorina citri]|uniref:Phosphatidylglycerophosphatase and protein-tyrosine phosphatase 1 n=1 Tax=Diaphorina citri TaxID=121845 RepID=A0A1S3D016_DIACI|nr:phosphatidylglycerophosphatase and protein-tyrosine phosphatase 1-like [Diaphorina citri]KAI5709464.1 hypothetical protein M8J75_000433 [Diaphorina citri]KAI5745944.1 hypothetical protein M8J76_015738 [Diaphorina citri]KAI5753004.1 hypothetical protein M8J77_022606 [Diaphorina citri]
MNFHDVWSKIGFLPSLLYVFLADRTGIENFYTRIDKNVILGALPSNSVLEKITTEENVKGVISVVRDWELKLFNVNFTEWEGRGVAHLQLDTIEFEAPSLYAIEKGLEFIQKVAQSGGVTYIHCKAGRSRSATLTACYLIKNYNMNPDDAVKYITYKRKQIRITKTEKAQIDQCYNIYGSADGSTRAPVQVNDDI